MNLIHRVLGLDIVLNQKIDKPNRHAQLLDLLYQMIVLAENLIRVHQKPKANISRANLIL